MYDFHKDCHHKHNSMVLSCSQIYPPCKFCLWLDILWKEESYVCETPLIRPPHQVRYGVSVLFTNNNLIMSESFLMTPLGL